MSINSSGRKLEGFFTGKGFYIVLFLCAAVIGLSAWMMAAGNEAMDDLTEMNSISFDPAKVETIIIPPQSQTEDSVPVIAPEAESAPVISPAEDSVSVWNETEVMAVESPLYVWPLEGELERSHQLESLSYDVTLRDWRTHDGIDIAAPLGASVAASRAGSVCAIEQDSLYGTVVSIDHGDGMLSIYANLAELPAVELGAWVEPGDTIGSVGTTALCEVGQGTHLHFAMSLNGESVDPTEYLPE